MKPLDDISIVETAGMVKMCRRPRTSKMCEPAADGVNACCMSHLVGAIRMPA